MGRSYDHLKCDEFSSSGIEVMADPTTPKILL